MAARDTSSLTFYMFLFGALFWAVAMPWWTFDLSTITGTTSMLGAFDNWQVPVWSAIAWIVVLGTLAPYSLNLAALRHVSPTAVGVVGMSEPLGAGLVAWAWLGQLMTAIQILGGFVVLAGIALVQRSTSPVAATLRKNPGEPRASSAAESPHSLEPRTMPQPLKAPPTPSTPG